MNSVLLTPQQIEKEYLIPVQTQRVWKCANRYGWANLTVKLGRRTVYRREDIERWLASRTGITV